MFRRSIPVKPATTTVGDINPLIAFNEPIKVASHGTRDSMIAKLKEVAPLAPFLKPLTEHLLKMGRNKLDTYNKMDFILEEYNITIHFITSLVGGDEMSYTFPSNPGDPPPELLRTKFLGLF